MQTVLYAIDVITAERLGSFPARSPRASWLRRGFSTLSSWFFWDSPDYLKPEITRTGAINVYSRYSIKTQNSIGQFIHLDSAKSGLHRNHGSRDRAGFVISRRRARSEQSTLVYMDNNAAGADFGDTNRHFDVQAQISGWKRYFHPPKKSMMPAA